MVAAVRAVLSPAAFGAPGAAASTVARRFADSDAEAGADAQRPCLIVNPQSFRAADGLAEKAAAMMRAQSGEVVFAVDPGAWQAAIDAILAQRRRRVILLAGDGTVHFFVDRLARLPAEAWKPELLLLPGGRTNLTARDLSPGGDALGLLAEALVRIRDGRWAESLVERAVLRIEQPPERERFGFFAAAAWLDQVIRRVHEHRAGGIGRWRTGSSSTGWGLMRLVGAGLLGRSTLACPNLRVEAGAVGRLDGAVRLLLITTLQHRVGSFDPYADRGEGALRMTAVQRGARGFLRSLPRLATGRYTASMDAGRGYLSGRCERLEVGGLDGYTLDGETFETDASRPVVFTPGPRLRFASF